MIAALFVRSDSIYFTLPGVDAWDKERNALNWPGGYPVVAHPPCRAWGKMRHFSKPEPGEKYLALWAISQVRRWGGVLEHPAHSLLWPVADLPEPGKRDAYGGFTLSAPQYWWGHKTDKATRLYVCGCAPDDLPPLPYRLGFPEYAINLRQDRPNYRRVKLLPRKERDVTPPNFARWLLGVAGRCRSAGLMLTI